MTGRKKMPAKSPEQRALARAQQLEHAEITRAAAVHLGRAPAHVRQCWGELKHMAIGLVMGDEECVAVGRALLDERWPPLDEDAAVKIMAWAIRKIGCSARARVALEQAIDTHEWVA